MKKTVKEFVTFCVCLFVTGVLAFAFWVWAVFPFSVDWSWQIISLYYIMSGAVAAGIYCYLDVS